MKTCLMKIHMPRAAARPARAVRAIMVAAAICAGCGGAAAVHAADAGTKQPAASTARKPAPAPASGLAKAQRGTQAAGQRLEDADRSARAGIERGSERAAAPLRRWGESLGRRLPGAGGGTAPPPVGPQSGAP